MRLSSGMRCAKLARIIGVLLSMAAAPGACRTIRLACGDLLAISD
jgi:hypothetical protein